MMFCATIWESNMSIVLISATPQMISANAIGMPERHRAEQREGKDRDGHRVLLRFP